jgi:hypothetical protein
MDNKFINNLQNNLPRLTDEETLSISREVRERLERTLRPGKASEAVTLPKRKTDDFKGVSDDEAAKP